jgi:TatD DNase family protein
MSGFAGSPLIDTHCHIQDPDFDIDRDDVLRRAWSAGLVAIVCVGYDLESSRRAVELAERHSDVFATVGIHPNSASQAERGAWAEISALARREKVVGVGETGLDYYRKYTPPGQQEESFRWHLDLAAQLGLPVVVHNREANSRVRAILEEWVARLPAHRPRGVMHCFSADAETLEGCLKNGFDISFAGPVTFKNADTLRTLAARVPRGRLVVETDSPYLTPEPRRGKRNEPAFVEHTARRLAETRGESFGELSRHTTQTAGRLFGISLPDPSEAVAS